MNFYVTVVFRCHALENCLPSKFWIKALREFWFSDWSKIILVLFCLSSTDGCMPCLYFWLLISWIWLKHIPFLCRTIMICEHVHNIRCLMHVPNQRGSKGYLNLSWKTEPCDKRLRNETIVRIWAYCLLYFYIEMKRRNSACEHQIDNSAYTNF